MRKLYLIGSSGYPNFGDEAVARAWVRWLAHNHPDDEVWLDCPWPGSAAALLAAEHPRLRCVDTLFHLGSGATTAWEAVNRATRALSPHGPGADRLHGLRALAQADVVHMIGGGYANGLWPHQLGVLGAVAEAGRLHGARTAMTGQGLLPLSRGAVSLVRRLADRLDVVDVRDEPSAEALGITASCDDLFLDLGSALDLHREDAPDVVLVVQGDLHDSAHRIADLLLARVDDWGVEPSDVAVLEGIPGLDRPIFDLLAPLLPGLRFVPFVELWDRGLPVRAEQRWITTRFHPHLLAAAVGASGIALSVHPNYYGVKHGSLSALGSGWPVVGLDASLPDAGRAGRIAEQAPSLTAAKQRLARAIYGP